MKLSSKILYHYNTTVYRKQNDSLHIVRKRNIGGLMGNEIAGLERKQVFWQIFILFSRHFFEIQILFTKIRVLFAKIQILLAKLVMLNKGFAC